MEYSTTGLQRKLKNRHIQLIALGGSVGTGLFLGSGSVLKTAGPSMILGYMIAGLISFLIIRQMGEMVAEEPVAGAFSYFAYRYWGPFAGFLSGWNYWILYVLVSMVELTAIGTYVRFWFPQVPAWVSALGCFLLINGINLANVRHYGEAEFWFASIKVSAVIAMILFGVYLLCSGQGGPQAHISNLWSDGGFFPHGFSGMFMMLAVIMFSFGGLEMIGLTAAEAENPQTMIPRAVNQVLVRILIFYIGSLVVLLSLYPWSRVADGGSPFVMIFRQIGAGVIAHVLNFVVLTAALSVYNGCVYATSRMLFGLAEQGHAPRTLGAVDHRGVPVRAILLTALATVICVILNSILPGQALAILMSLVVAAAVINWIMISLTHIKFRQARRGRAGRFPALCYPLGNGVCVLFMLMILGILLYTPGAAISVYLLPIWVLLLWAGYRLIHRVGQGAKI